MLFLNVLIFLYSFLFPTRWTCTCCKLLYRNLCADLFFLKYLNSFKDVWIFSKSIDLMKFIPPNCALIRVTFKHNNYTLLYSHLHMLQLHDIIMLSIKDDDEKFLYIDYVHTNTSISSVHYV